MADPTWLVTLKIAAVFFLVFLNGFFVAAEFAIVKVRSTQLAAVARRGDPRAKRAQHLVEHLDAYLSATQLGITLASLGLGWIGEPAVADLIAPALLRFGIESEAVLHTIAFSIAFATITFLHIILGELAPKSIAIQRAQGTTLAIARPLHWFYLVFKPAITVLNGSANWLLKLVGIRPASESERAHSEEELRLLLAEARQGQTSAMGRELILNALDLRRREVREIMVPRPRVVALNAAQSAEANLRVAWEAGYTRFPLTERGDLDRLTGMVHLKDLIRLSQAPEGKDLASIRRELPMVPEGMAAETLLNLLLAKHVHMAAVIDEHGGTVGLVTLEDILEELVGEIQDEFDEEVASVRRVADNEYLADGAAPLYEVADLLDLPLKSREVSTIGGYVVERLGRIPAVGERVELPGVSVLVRSADRKRVKSLLLTRKSA